jgi:hypothetical protein
MRLIAAASSDAEAMTTTAAAAKALSPICSVKTTTPTIQARIAAMLIHCARVSRACSIWIPAARGVARPISSR